MNVAFLVRQAPDLQMTAQVFLVALTLGAGAIALWINARFPKLAPEGMRTAFIHVGVALVAGMAVVPALDTLVSSTTSPVLRAIITTFIVGLPILIYSLLASIWVILIAQGAMRRYR
jgi:hypothetical protein